MKKRFILVILCGLYVALLVAILIMVCCDNNTENVSNMPPANIQVSAAAMKSGNEAWAQPWTMWIDSSGKCFINGNDQVFHNPIKNGIQLTRNDNGFIVDLSSTTFVWAKDIKAGFTNGNQECLRVTEFRRAAKVESNSP